LKVLKTAIQDTVMHKLSQKKSDCSENEQPLNYLPKTVNYSYLNKFCQICMSILDPETHYSRDSQLFLAQTGNSDVITKKYTSNFNHCTYKN
jgi:hypothetical protein